MPSTLGTAGVSPHPVAGALVKESAGRPRSQGGCMEHLGCKHIMCHVSDIRRVATCGARIDGSATSRTAQNAMEFGREPGWGNAKVLPGSAG
jgi:hypothetical protein